MILWSHSNVQCHVVLINDWNRTKRTFKNFHNAWAESPLTSIFSNISNFIFLSEAKQTISSLLPGSCPANWLQGNARILKPEKHTQITITIYIYLHLTPWKTYLCIKYIQLYFTTMSVQSIIVYWFIYFISWSNDHEWNLHR